MTSIGELSVDLSLDTSQLDKQIAEIPNRYNNSKINLGVDSGRIETALRSLDGRVANLQVEIQKLASQIQSIQQQPIVVKPTVDSTQTQN